MRATWWRRKVSATSRRDPRGSCGFSVATDGKAPPPRSWRWYGSGRDRWRMVFGPLQMQVTWTLFGSSHRATPIAVNEPRPSFPTSRSDGPQHRRTSRARMWSVKSPLENQDPFDVRPLTFGDIPSCLPIFEAAERDLRARHGLAVDESSQRDWLAPILTHFLTTDRSGSRIATLDGEAVAFGCSIRRDDFWFLSFLFALPRLQGRGLGRKLLTELLPGDDVALATVVESFQPVSTGLYASVGMAPRSVKYWVGDISRPNVLPSLPNGIIRSESTERDVADIDTLDRT